MRIGSIQGLAATGIASALIFHSLCGTKTLGDDGPGRLGRLFRMGGLSAAPAQNPPYRPPVGTSGPATSAPTTGSSVPSYYGQPALSTPPSTLSGPAAPPIKPKARTTKPITEADPLVTRISLGRSNEGTQFGMLLQIFADGTVIDGEGVHKIGPDALKPVIEAVGSGELAKLKGHCGGAAGDFIETVHVVAFDRAYGRLRASSFSYSGSTEGCDHAVHHLQKVLDEVQARVSSTGPTSAPSTVPMNAPAGPLGAAPASATSTTLAMPNLPAPSIP